MTNPMPPLILAASDIWAGNDGNWSTWSTKVGSSLQSFHILPSTSHGEVWIPGPQGCTSSSTPLLCAASRGVGELRGAQSLGFQENSSSTWGQIGIYEFITGGDLFQTTETGLYGLDNVVIVEHNTSMKRLTVAGVVTKDFWLGSFGLEQVQSEFPVESGTLPSLLDRMKEENLTSTASFSLAVGAAYRPASGNLIIGGYDQDLFQDPGVAIPISTNHTRSLVAHVRSVVASNTLNGTLSAAFDLPSLPMAIDSGVSQLWLPKTVCENLAGALGLTYDLSTELYLVNDTTRTKLLELSPEFTFTMAANATSSDTANIVLPYAAFDLEVGQPFYNTTRRYFPIRQAPNDNLYVLGRTFLQETYLVVDWERGNFTLSQAKHDSTRKDIVTILPLDDEEETSTGLRPGVIAGVVAGILSGMVAVAIAVYVLRWRRKSSSAMSDRIATSSPYPEDKKEPDASELPGTSTIVAEASSVPIHELHQDPLRQQLMSTPIYELPGERFEGELDTGPSKAAKIEGESQMLDFHQGGEEQGVKVSSLGATPLVRE